MAMSPRLLRPVASGFSPKRIPGLQLWFDASVSSSVTLNGSDVSQINDLSGNNRHLEQTTAANQPAYLTAGRNGKNVLDFGSTNGKWLRQTASSANTISQPLTGFWAMKTPASGTTYIVSDVLNAALDGTGRINFYGNVTTEMRFEAGVSNNVQVSADTWYVITCVFDGTASKRRINTTSPATFSAGTRNYNDRLIVGANFGTSGGYRSLIGELGFYSGSLTDAQHTALLNYLAKKWGITLT